MDLTPGDWLPTRWGAAHRIRAVDGGNVTLVCDHTDTQHAAADITTGATTERCRDCARTPGLGPLPTPVLHEVRRHQPTGAIAVCTPGSFGRRDPQNYDRCWLLVDAGTGHGPDGTRLLPLDVADWAVIGHLTRTTT